MTALSARDSLFVALQNLRHEPGRAIVLASALALSAFLPIATWLASNSLERSLMARSETTPILVGAPGNDYDLALSSLYFKNRPQATIPLKVALELRARGSGLVAPLYMAHSIQGVPLVATDESYFTARGLRISTGRKALQLGEIVAGCAIARRFELEPGDQVKNDLSNLYNLSGSYPFVLRVVGILEPAGNADDEAFFTGLKTSWTLDGRMHGHQAIASDETLADEEGVLEASAATFMFAELSAANRESFHLHGNQSDAPISVALIFPENQKQHDLLLGELAVRDGLQSVRPRKIVETVFAIVLRLRALLTAYFLSVAAATLLLSGLIFALTARLRRGDLQLLRDLGASRLRILLMAGTEIIVLSTFAAGLCALLCGIALTLLRTLISG